MSSFCSKASLILRRKMAEIQPLLNNYQQENDEELQQQQQPMIVAHNNNINVRNRRIASLDVFRGLSIFLMVLVDYAGSSLPAISHAPWNGLHLADIVMPMFLFAAGVSLAIVYKHQKVQNRYEATWKALVRAAKLFLLGVFLQGGYLHGITSLTYGVDVETIRLLGILQRIAIGYLAAAVCEIWLPRQTWRKEACLRNYIWHWCAVFFLCAIYIGLTYGLYVADWQFKDLNSLSSLVSENGTAIHTVKCSVRGDLRPACNAAGMIDRYVLGIDHLYQKSVYRNLKECNISKGGQVPESSPSWCHAPFEPEGILSSLTASVACIIGLQYGHILTEIQGHKDRLYNWCLMSFLFLVLGSILALAGIPVNKSLYTISYMLVTSAASGITFCALYLVVDVYGWRHITFALEWMGKHSLSIFILVASNLFVIALQGFYWKSPHNNIIYWIVSHVVQK
uniref:heparan-alpha-glucosaminide N-acetyltransferase-like n=1 Tax=Erigeron canadensis TaxID=72917 RepID=UPI001CB91EA5|nr:heparan-alpha-glucosaminide N-acetyltransferase-like [Erigeron canadensis]